LFIAFRPDLFLPTNECRREVSRRIDMIKAPPRNALRRLAEGNLDHGLSSLKPHRCEIYVLTFPQQRRKQSP
jgi:hypothetical protein